MSIVTEFTAPASEFLLEETLAAAPDITVEGERIVTHSHEWTMPFVWVSGPEFEPFDRALPEDDTVAEHAVLDDFGRTRLYEITWVDEWQDRITRILNMGGTIMEASAEGETWDVAIRFADREHLSDLQQYFDEHDAAWTLRRLYRPNEPRQIEFGLTPDQRKTLIAALNSGYYETPRGVTMEELADKFDISANAASERLRRAHATLVEHTMTVGRHD